VLCYTWYTILSSDYFATQKHKITLLAFGIVLVSFLFDFVYGILLAGVFLLLATFNVLAIFPSLSATSYFIKIAGREFSTPSIEWTAFLLLIVYLALDLRYLIDGFKAKLGHTQL